MASIKYAVWFHGNKEESEGICYCGREPYIVDKKSLAEEHMSYLQNACDGLNKWKFSICKIVVDEVADETLE